MAEKQIEFTPEYSIARQFIDMLENVMMFDPMLAGRFKVLPRKVEVPDDPMEVFQVHAYVYSEDFTNPLRDYTLYVRMDDYNNLQLFDENTGIYRNISAEEILFQFWRMEMTQTCQPLN